MQGVTSSLHSTNASRLESHCISLYKNYMAFLVSRQGALSTLFFVRQLPIKTLNLVKVSYGYLTQNKHRIKSENGFKRFERISGVPGI